MYKVAITGSIASGKSTICHFLEERGAYTVDADQIVHQAYTINTTIGRKIVDLLGEGIVSNGILQREAIAEIVTDRPELLEDLEDICHPYVNSVIISCYQAAQTLKRSSLFVAEVPLLFESRYPLLDWFDVIVLVLASRHQAFDRFSMRGKPNNQFSIFSQRQSPQEDKQYKADVIIINDADLLKLRETAGVLFDLLCYCAAGRSPPQELLCNSKLYCRRCSTI